MAGFWIKMESNLATKPEVIMLAATFDCDEDLIVGKLHRLWSWFDDHTEDGKCNQITSNWIDRYLRLDGFAQALLDCGWLLIKDGVIELPNWDNHNGETAKRRAKDNKRKGQSKPESKDKQSSSKDAPQVIQNDSAKVPRECGNNVEETKNRAEQSKADTDLKNKTPLPPHEGEDGDLLELEQNFVAEWNLLEGVVLNQGASLTSKRRRAFRARAREPAWDWREAFRHFPLKCFEGEPSSWRPSMDWILKPDNVLSIIEGKYDWTKSENRAGGGVDRSLEARQREAERNGTAGTF